MTEADRGDRATGPGRLAALLAGCAGAGAAAIAEAVERDALESRAARRATTSPCSSRARLGGGPARRFGGAGVAAAT